MGFQGPSPPPPVLFCLTGCFVPSITLPWGAGTVEAAPLLGPELVHALQDLRPCPNTGTQPTRGPVLWAVHTRCWAKGISFQSLEGAQSGSCLLLTHRVLSARRRSGWAGPVLGPGCGPHRRRHPGGRHLLLVAGPGLVPGPRGDWVMAAPRALHASPSWAGAGVVGLCGHCDHDDWAVGAGQSSGSLVIHSLIHHLPRAALSCESCPKVTRPSPSAEDTQA